MRDVMLVITILLVIGSFAILLMLKKRRGSPNVAILQEYKRRKKKRSLAQQSASPHPGTGGKKCSHCGKQAKRITFYADDSGTVIGLCPACKPIAERRDLMPL
jgi:hypothetical protein